MLYALNDYGSGVWQSDATGTNDSALPSGLVNGTSAIALDELDNYAYTGGSNSDMSVLRTMIGNTSNWTGSNTVRQTMPTNPLPVELTSFSASSLNNGVMLNWATATEIDNYGYDIERRSLSQPSQREGAEASFHKIGFVNGSGNSVSTKGYSYLDKSLTSGTYEYRLKQIDFSGKYEYSKAVEVKVSNKPSGFQLSQNYPNPFNPSTKINFNTAQSGNVSLIIYNVLGQQVRTLVNGFMEAGEHTINFSAEGLQSGLYFYKLQSSGMNEVKKMTLLKYALSASIPRNLGV